MSEDTPFLHQIPSEQVGAKESRLVYPFDAGQSIDKDLKKNPYGLVEI